MSLPGEEFRCEGRVQYISRHFALLFGAVFVAAEAMNSARDHYGHQMFPWWNLAILAILLPPFAAVVWKSFFRRGTLSCSGEGVRCGGRLIVPASKIREARLVHTRFGPAVRLGIEGWVGACLLQLRSDHDAEGVMHALATADRPRNQDALVFGLDKAYAVIAFPAVVFALIMLAIPSFHLSRLKFLAFFYVGIIWPIAFFRPWERQALLGADGLRIVATRKWPRPRPRFVPYGSIRGIAREQRRVVVELADATKLVMPFAAEEAAEQALGALSRALRESHVPSTSVGALQRGDRKAAEWIASLRVAGSGMGDDYRVRATMREELSATLEASGLPAAERLAAAVALTAREGATAAPLLARVAARTADPVLERGLRAMAEGSEEEIASALDEAEGADAAAAASARR